VVRMRKGNTLTVLVREPKEQNPLERNRRTW